MKCRMQCNTIDTCSSFPSRRNHNNRWLIEVCFEYLKTLSIFIYCFDSEDFPNASTSSNALLNFSFSILCGKKTTQGGLCFCSSQSSFINTVMFGLCLTSSILDTGTVRLFILPSSISNSSGFFCWHKWVLSLLRTLNIDDLVNFRICQKISMEIQLYRQGASCLKLIINLTF